jgi:TRAP-type transport system periplasmic protein
MKRRIRGFGSVPGRRQQRNVRTCSEKEGKSMRSEDLRKVGGWSAVLGCAVLFLVAMITPALAGQPIVLRLGTGDPAGASSTSTTSAKFAELANQKSNGELDVKVFYQSLGTEAGLTEQVVGGSVDMGTCAMGNLSRFTDAFLTLDLPFLFKGDAAVLEFLEKDPQGKKVIEKFEKDAGLKVVLPMTHTSTSEVNGANISTRNKLLRVPADIKGLKLRTMTTPVDQALFKAWGANPTPVDWAQLYSALQQGVVDGSTGSTLPAYASIKMYEVTKFYLAMGFRNFTLPMFINAKKFNSLTPAQQQALMDAGAEAGAFNRKDALGFVERALDATKKAGTQIYFPTPDEYAQWASVRDKVWQEVAEHFKGKVDLTLANYIKGKYGR